jgi:outer membrane receptor for ferrienterochelin and colicins
MQLYKRIRIGFLVIFTVSGIQLSFAVTDSGADLFQMGEVVVTGTKTERRLKDTPVITEVITRSEIEATGAENIGEVLEHRVGIVVDRDAHGDGVQLQGLDSDYILILLDGEPQVGRIAGKLDLARIAVENVERIEVVKGASSALFGSAAMGGVINVITRKASSPFAAQFTNNFETHNTIDSRSTVELKRDKFNALLTLAANRRNPIDLDESDLTTTIDGYQNWTHSTRAEYQLTSKSTLLFSGQYLSQKQEGISETEDVVFDRLGDIGNFSGSVGTGYQLGSRSKLTGKIYTARYRDESTVIDRDTSLTESSNVTVQDLIKGEAQFDTALGSKNQLTVGAELIFENLESQRITGGEKDVTTDSVFFQNEFRPIANLALVLGGRLDYHSEFGTHFSPKLSGLYHVTRDVTIRTSFGQGFRAPDFKDLYLDFSNSTSGYQVLGNPDLQPESSGNWNLGVEYQFKSALLGRVHLYRNNLKNLIEAERIGTSVLGGSKFQHFNVSEAFTEGVEVELSTRSIGGFAATIGYAYLNGKDKETGLTLLNRSKHSGNLKLAYTNQDTGFNVDLRGRYASRWGFFDDGDKVLEDEEYAPSNWIWNLRGSKQVLKWLKASVGVNNIFDFKIPNFYTFTGRSFYGRLSLVY